MVPLITPRQAHNGYCELLREVPAGGAPMGDPTYLFREVQE